MIRTGSIQKWSIPGEFPDLTDKNIRRKLKHVWGYFVEYKDAVLSYTGTRQQLEAFIEECKKLVVF